MMCRVILVNINALKDQDDFCKDPLIRIKRSEVS